MNTRKRVNAIATIQYQEHLNNENFLMEKIIKLLDRDADIAAWDNKGNTILHILINKLEPANNALILSKIRILVTIYHANINMFNKEKMTPLQLLINQNHIDIHAVIELINLGAIISLPDKQGETVLLKIAKGKIKVESHAQYDTLLRHLIHCNNKLAANLSIPDKSGFSLYNYLALKTNSTSAALNIALGIHKKFPTTKQDPQLIVKSAHLKRENYIQYGGHAIVYHGKWNENSVAIKEINYNFHNLSKCNHEMLIMQKLTELNSKNLVQFCGYTLTTEKYSIVMEYVAGSDLRTLIQQNKLYSWHAKHIIMLGLTNGIYALHSANVVHGDLKPENVLITDDEKLTVKLCDFSDSKEIDNCYEPAGTIGYIAPENSFSCRKPFNKASDIFACGTTFWEVVHEKSAYEKMDTLSVHNAIAEGKRLPIDESHGEIKNLIDDCWRQDPNERPTIENVIERLAPLKK